jgi:tyrosyl-tRNA synthetase
MNVKKELASSVVTEFHSAEDALAARQEFERVFSGGHLPQEIPEIVVEVAGDSMLLSKLLVEGGLASSNSDARRLIQQGGVRVDGESVRDTKAEMTTTSSQPALVQVGKRRIAKVRFSRD